MDGDRLSSDSVAPPSSTTPGLPSGAPTRLLLSQEDEVSSEMPSEPQGLGNIPNIRIEAPQASSEFPEAPEPKTLEHLAIRIDASSLEKSQFERLREDEENATLEGVLSGNSLRGGETSPPVTATPTQQTAGMTRLETPSGNNADKMMLSVGSSAALSSGGSYQGISSMTVAAANSTKVQSLAMYPRPRPSTASVDSSDMVDSFATRCLQIYTRKVVSHPRKLICFYSILLVGSIVLGFILRPFELDTDFSAFIRADGLAMRRREAYISALLEKKGMDARRLQESSDSEGKEENDVEESDLNLDEDIIYSTADDQPVDFEEEELARFNASGRRLQSAGGVRYFSTVQLVLMYVGDGDTLDNLKGIVEFERGLRRLKGWQELCSMSITMGWLCDPGVSLSAYAFPTKSVPTKNWQEFELNFNADGETMLPKPVFLSYLQQSDNGVEDVNDKHIRRNFAKTFELPPVVGDVVIPPATGLRSVFPFRLAVGSQGMSMSEVKANSGKMKQKWKKFVEEELYPYLANTKTDGFSAYYYGEHLTGYEVTYTIRKDALWCIPSMGFVLVYLYFHTRSKLLTVACLLIIFSSVPLAYAMTPASKVTIASFLSLFLITGIGSDVVFVFKDFWDRSALMTNKLDKRLSWMMLHAGKSCLATSLTTSVSFFANLKSVLQPLREFGLFMGLCVMDAYLLVLLFLPPFFVICEALKNNSKVDPISEESTISEDRGSDMHDPEAFSSIVPVNQEGKCDPVESAGSSAPKKNNGDYVTGMLLWIFGLIARRPKKILLFFGLLIVGFVIGIVTQVEMATGVPEVFPAEHNQVKYEEWQSKFYTLQPIKSSSAPEASACKPGTVEARSPSSTHPCAVHWCETASDATYGDEMSGHCQMAPVNPGSPDPWSSAGCEKVKLISKVSGLKAPQLDDWVNVFFEPLARRLNATILSRSRVTQELQRLTIENWETGGIKMSNFFNMGWALAEVNSGINYSGQTKSVCEVATLCYFGVQQCQQDGWQSLGVHRLTQAPRRLDRNGPEGVALAVEDFEMRSPRRLQIFKVYPEQAGLHTGPQIPGSKQTMVSLLFGIRPPPSTPLVGAPDWEWMFDPTYEPTNPWAQRAMLDACLNLDEDLLVIASDCWIYKFKDWLLTDTSNKGARFPTRDFNAKIAQFFRDPVETITATANLWIADSQVKASKLEFRCNFASDAGAKAGVEYQKKWNAYVERMNNAASLTANRAYATAAVFKRAEAEEALKSSTIETIVIAAVFAWLGCAFFTGSITLACLVTALVLGIIAGLAFFMVALMDWDIGAIEVVSLVVFMGYAVTYSLHIAHNYGEVGLEIEELVQREEAWVAKEQRRLARKERRKQRAYEERKGQPYVKDPAENQQEAIADLMRNAATERRGLCAPVKEGLVALRRAKTRMAIIHVGGATLSSAISTLGSSFFLLFCTMNIFVKLGLVVIAVTILSIIFALVPLQAVLMVCGPRETCFKSLTRDRKTDVSEDMTDPRQPLVHSPH